MTANLPTPWQATSFECQKCALGLPESCSLPRTPMEHGSTPISAVYSTVGLFCTATGMVQAWVAQKTCKRNILRVFYFQMLCQGPQFYTNHDIFT